MGCPADDDEYGIKYPNIEDERIKRKLSQSDVAKSLGVRVDAYYGWMDGTWKIPKCHIEKLGLMFKCSVDFLLAPDDRHRRWKRYAWR